MRKPDEVFCDVDKMWYGVIVCSVMTSEPVTISEIATKFGIDKSGARRYLLKKGFTFLRIRRRVTGNQEELALDEAEYLRALKVRREDGYR